jgi:hypothetical protein
MENQTVINSSVNPTPSSQQSTPQQPKTNIIMPILLTILISGVVFGFGGYYFGSQQKTPLVSTITELAPTVLPSLTETINSSKFAETLNKYCLNKKIALDKLPFSFNLTIRNAYNIQDSIDCYVPGESYASIAIIVKTPDFSGDTRDVYFFHQNSKWEGQGNNFQPITNYHQISINGNTYWLNVRDPDPYGISTIGVWIDIIGEKQDIVSGTIVRAIDNEILNNQDLLDLVKKYGVKQSEKSFPEYIITDPTKKAQFIQEIVNLAGQHPAFKVPAQHVTSDLDGIIFK